jgi:1-phosphofructokinase
VIVTVTPNPSLDLTYLLPAGGNGLNDPTVEVHRADSATLEASGKGVNVSRALTLAGRSSTAVLFAGGATGHQLLDLLAAERVPYRTVLQAGPTRVNTTVLTAGAGTTKVNAPGTAPTPDEIDNLVVAVDNELITLSSEVFVRNASSRRIDPEGWLLICGSLPPGVDAGKLIGRLVGLARAKGWRVAVDSSGAGLSAGFEAGADLLAPNGAELNAVRPGPPAVGTDAIILAAAEVARERGCELLVSLGAEGALWTDGRRALHAKGPAVVPVNSAGAGDALLAGWFCADPGVDPAVRLATAVAWGTAACLVPTTVAVGGTPPAVDEILVVERLTEPLSAGPEPAETGLSEPGLASRTGIAESRPAEQQEAPP